MSLHFLDFYEPVESPFEEDLMYARGPFRLSEHESKERLEISRESRVYICLESSRLKTRSRIIYYDHIIDFIDIKSNAYILAFSEKCSEISYTSSLDTDRGCCRQRSEYDKCPTFNIIAYYCCFSYLSVNYRTIYDHIMIYTDIDTYSESTYEFNEIHHMGLYCSEFYGSFSCAECCHHEYIFCCCYCKVGTESDIFSMINSLECDIFSFTHIGIAICEKSVEVFIYRSFSDIATSRIRYFQSSKSSQESRKEKYTNADFFYLLTIEIFYGEIWVIHDNGTPCPNDSTPKRFYDREKCQYITDTRNIVEGKSIKENPCCY